MTIQRDQCGPCPWREPEELPDYAVEAAADGAEFVCHTRCGPCPGPTLAGIAPEGAPTT